MRRISANGINELQRRARVKCTHQSEYLSFNKTLQFRLDYFDKLHSSPLPLKRAYLSSFCRSVSLHPLKLILYNPYRKVWESKLRRKTLEILINNDFQFRISDTDCVASSGVVSRHSKSYARLYVCRLRQATGRLIARLTMRL